MRALYRLVEPVDHPPFQVSREGEEKIMKEKAADVLAYVLADAQKEFTITRFKGLGEMNPEQLWATTMNGEASHAAASENGRRRGSRKYFHHTDG